MRSRSCGDSPRGCLAPLAIFVAAALGACSTDAPPLPPDTTAINRVRTVEASEFAAADLALSCEEIARQRDEIGEAIRIAHARVAANSENNQVASYLGGVLFAPLLLATEGNYEDKDVIRNGHAKRDMLLRLAAFKNCPG